MFANVLLFGNTLELGRKIEMNCFTDIVLCLLYYIVNFIVYKFKRIVREPSQLFYYVIVCILCDGLHVLVSCGCYCSLSLLYGAVDWSALCDSAISRSFSLPFCSYGFLFNCTMVGQASDSMTTLTKTHRLVTCNA